MTLTVVGTLALDTLALVDALAAPEATGGVRRLHPDLPGGTAGNVAMALARLGAPPRLLAAVGADFAGSAYERALAGAGVDAGGLTRAPGPTARAYVFYERGGKQVTYFYGGEGENALRSPPGALDGARAHFCAGDIAAYPALMRRAAWVSFDPGQEVHHRPLREVLACLGEVDLLFLNRHERERLARDAGLTLDKVFSEGAAMVVESRGAEGTVLHEPGGGETRVPAAPADAREPTGAGDAHRAGFLFALERGARPRDAARFASVLGAAAVEGIGAQSSLPTLDEARRRYQSAYGERCPF